MRPRLRRAIRVLAVMALAAAALGARGDEAGRAAADGESRQSVGDFSAQLILVADDAHALKVWEKPQETLTVGMVRSVAVGAQANAFVVFRGCTPDASGQCDVTMRLRVLQPDGKVYVATPPMEVWQYKPPPPVRLLQLSAQYLKIVVEPQDPPGRYVVSASVKDHVSGASLQLGTVFEATR